MRAVGRARLAPLDRALQPPVHHHALDALMIDRPTHPFQQGDQAPIAIRRLLTCQVEQRYL